MFPTDEGLNSGRVVRTDTLPELLRMSRAPLGLHHPALPICVPTLPRLRRTRLEPIAEAQEFSRWRDGQRFPYEQKFLSEMVEGVVLPEIECAGFDRVLHLGCRGGDWALDLAQECPATWVVGIDKDQLSIDHANELAVLEGLANVEFLARNFDTSVLAGYEQRPFNLIYLSFLAEETAIIDLSDLLDTLVEHCVPGGSILWVEMAFPLTNSEAVERFRSLLLEGMRVAGRAIGTCGYPGVTPLMRSWLLHAGCRIKYDTASAVDISRGSSARNDFVHYMDAFGKRARQYVLASGVANEQTYDRLFVQALEDMISFSFCGVCYVRVVHAVRDPRLPYVEQKLTDVVML